MAYGIVRWAGRVTDVRLKGVGRVAQLTGGRKQALTEWSAQSRRNLLRQLMACDWSSVAGYPVMVTLTYADVQMDGRQCRRDLQNFRRAWEREWGSAVGAWKLEFQARGAAHWHLVLFLPSVILGRRDNGRIVIGWQRRGGEWGSSAHAQAWVLRTWQRIVGFDTTRVEFAAWRGRREDFAWYFGGYASKKSKEYQNKPPEGSSGWGRRWGLWGIRPVWDEVVVTERQAYRLRRVLRGIQRARAKRSPRRFSGWTIHDSRDARANFQRLIWRLSD